MNNSVETAGLTKLRRGASRSTRRTSREPQREQLAVRPGLLGGQYRPLTDCDMQRIHNAALTLLENVGMAKPIPILRERALAKGCKITDGGRLCFPRALVEDVIAGAARSFMVYGRNSKHDMEFSTSRVHFDPGGEAVRTLDFKTKKFRPSTLVDVYDLSRLIDQLEHIHRHYHLIVATDIEDLREHDISRAYASFAGTTKHVSMSFNAPSHVEPVFDMACMIAGGEKKFYERPFCSADLCPVVSPMNYAEDASEVCIAATRFGSPVGVIIAPQAGATAPVALAGTLVQTIAETLAGLLLINLVVPGYPVLFGPWPFVVDLRTGSFSGGGGESALLNAAAAQMARFYDLPSNVSAGMTDAKATDNQAGYEKGISVVLAALAGANIVAESAGTLASIMAVSFESFVIDNDMLGMVQRVLRGIEVTDETLSVNVITEAVNGPGHFLAHPQTVSMMETEYLYPEVADRSSIGDWEEKGKKDIEDIARQRVQRIMSSHYPSLDPEIDKKIREKFPINLPPETMSASGGRW